MWILLLLALYLVLGLPFVGWLARRLGRAHDRHSLVSTAPAPEVNA